MNFRTAPTVGGHQSKRIGLCVESSKTVGSYPCAVGRWMHPRMVDGIMRSIERERERERIVVLSVVGCIAALNPCYSRRRKKGNISSFLSFSGMTLVIDLIMTTLLEHREGHRRQLELAHARNPGQLLRRSHRAPTLRALYRSRRVVH